MTDCAKGKRAGKTSRESVEQFSLEKGMAELEKIAHILESGEETLEASIELFEKGTKIYAQCKEKLGSLKLRIEKITSTTGDDSSNL